VELQVSYYKAKFALLLKISQTRFGAHAIFDAGLFQAIRASGLFTIDPDLGAGMKPSKQ
jgi:nuclear pore complex protein Nup205